MDRVLAVFFAESVLYSAVAVKRLLVQYEAGLAQLNLLPLTQSIGGSLETKFDM